MSINNISITGRLTANPVLRTTSNGTQMATACVAVQRDYVSKVDGTRGCDFLDILSFGNAASFLSRYFQKGSPIGVSGKVRTHCWKNSLGQNIKSTEIVTSNISFVGNKPADPASAQTYAPDNGGDEE